MVNAVRSTRTLTALTCSVATMFASMLGLAHAERFASRAIVFDRVTATIEVVTTNGDDIDVTIEQGGTYTPVIASLEEDVVFIRGQAPGIYDDDDRCCGGRIERFSNPQAGVETEGQERYGDGFFTAFPTIRVTMPRRGDASFRDTTMRIALDDLDGALEIDACYVYGETGNAEEAVIGVVNGSKLVVGDIAAALELDVSGAADVLIGDAASADVDVAGAGDVVLGSIDGMLDISIAGSGVVRTTRVEGPMTVRIAGSGGSLVQAGRADPLRATINGSGVVQMDGASVRPDLRLSRAAEVRLRSVSGRVNRRGSGALYIDEELIERR